MKAKWGLFMTEQKKNTIITSGIAVLAVILAYCFRIVGRGSFYPMLFSYLRSFIYIGLFAAWGLSVRQRIVQKQVCRFMTVTAVLLIIWMVVRSAKYFIFWQPDAVRYLWYLFYLPMLFVPMLALLIAMSLGKPDEYKFPKGMSVLWIISGVLLLLVLTNDLHQFIFIYSILYKPCIFKAYRLLNVQTLCIFPCFCPYEPKQGKFLFSADYLIQQSCGSTLRFPCSVSVNVHCGTDISVSEKFLHIFRCCTV